MPERWFVLTAHVEENDVRRGLLGEGLVAFGGSSVLDDATSLTTYLPSPSVDPDSYLLEAEDFLARWIGATAPALTWRWQENEDWAREWRRGLKPRKVSERIVVKPTWSKWQATLDEVVIEIDPQMAFGTGEHATTRGCLRLLDRHFGHASRVLDIGSGSAVLSIAAAKLGARKVVAVEFDPDANINARENIERNGVDGRIKLIEQLADPSLLATLGAFDIVLANILSGVIRPLLPALRDALNPDARLIVSGILQDECDTVVEDAQAAGLDLIDEDREEEWWSGVLVVRRS
jgi:ribosomal protein L11 methyltransferase